MVNNRQEYDVVGAVANDGDGMLPSFTDGSTVVSWRLVVRMPKNHIDDSLDSTEDVLAKRLIDTLGCVANEIIIRCGETLRGIPSILGYIGDCMVTDADVLMTQITEALSNQDHGDITIDEVTPAAAADVIAYLRRDGRYAGRQVNGRLHVGGIEEQCRSDTKKHDGGTKNGMTAKDGTRRKGSRTNSVVAIALETTGLDAKTCEIIRLAAYGNNGNTVYDRTFGVGHPELWSVASQEASGISPGDIAGLPTFRDCLASDAELVAMLDDADIIIAHNVLFVVEFLSTAGVHLDGKRFGDTCTCFSRYAMQRKLYRATRKLSTAAHAFKIPVPRHGHTNEKAYATYAVWLVLVDRHASELMDMEQLRAMWVRKHAKKAKRGKRQTEGV